MCTTSNYNTISITTNNSNTTTKKVHTNKMIIIIGFPITPSNYSHNTDLFYQHKIKDCMFRLKKTNICLQYVFFGHKRYFLPVLTLASQVLTIPHGASILARLHKALLPKLKTMSNFPLVIRSVKIEVGGLNIHYL